VIAKAIRRRFGRHTRRVSVRTEMPVYLRLLGIAFVGMAVAYFGWLVYLNAGSGQALPAAQSAVSRLESENAALTKHNATLRSEVAVLERQLQIERASHAELVKQVKVLTEDNSGLKEDVALVAAISASDPNLEGIEVSSARIRPNPVPGEYDYRIVLLQTGPRLKPFQGSYQLIINMMQDGARRGITLPRPKERAEAHYQLDFRVHHRIDGRFRIDPAAVVRSVQIRVFEAGQSQPKLMQTVTLS
jgi:cell division protein FtsB